MVASRTSIAALNLRTSDGEYTGDPSKGPPVRSVSWNVADRSATPLDQCVTYEEYHPFGTTSWWATASGTGVSAKRYRYTGKERDDETGLGYHGARYYAAWLGRWERPDPIGLKGGMNRFAYCRGNPVGRHDPTGTRDTGQPTEVITDDEGQTWLSKGSEEAPAEEIEVVGSPLPAAPGEPKMPGGPVALPPNAGMSSAALDRIAQEGTLREIFRANFAAYPDRGAARGLVRAFETDALIDAEPTARGRAETLLNVMARPIFGTPFGLPLNDSGFKPEFQDSGVWPSSSNQVGHFMTGVMLGMDPTYNPASSAMTLIAAAAREGGTQRAAVAAIVGHEQISDASGLRGLVEAPFLPSSQEIDDFMMGRLSNISVGTGEGNSRQDLALSYLGWRFGQALADDAFPTREDAALWLRANLYVGDK